MNRKMFATSILITLFQSQSILAGGFGMTGRFQFDLGTSTAGTRTGSGNPSSSVSGTVTQNLNRQCGPEEVESKKLPHLSLALIKFLMYNRDDFKVTDLGNSKHRIEIPNVISAGCLDNLELDQVRVEDGLGVAFKLPSNGGPDSGFKQMIACFKDKGLMNGDQLDTSKVERGHLRNFSFDIDVSSLDDNTIQSKGLYFVSPDHDPSGVDTLPWHEGERQIHDSNFKKCYVVENHVDGGYKIYKNRQISEAYAACSSNDLKRMLEAYQELDSSLTGNAAGAFKLAKKALEIAMKDQLEENSEKIIKKLREYNNNELKEAFTKMNNGKLEHDDAEDVIKGYAEILNELDEQVINPSINEIKALLEERKADGTTEARKDEIDKRIKDLNKIISEYDKKKVALGAERARSIAKKFALISEGGKDIVGFALKSKFWGQVGEGNRQISIEKAKKEINSGLKNFDRIADGWEREYDDFENANSGSLAPSREAGREMLRYRQAKDRAAQRYQEQEQKYASYCQQGMFGVQNPVRCQRYMSPQARQQRQRRFLQQREGLLKKENYFQNRYDYYDQLARDARQRDRDGGYGNDPFYSDYGFSNYDDPFYMDYNQFGDGGYSDYTGYSSSGGMNMPYYGQGQYGNQMQFNGGNVPYNIGGNQMGRYPAQGGQYNMGYNQNFNYGQPYGAVAPQYPMMY